MFAIKQNNCLEKKGEKKSEKVVCFQMINKLILMYSSMKDHNGL